MIDTPRKRLFIEWIGNLLAYGHVGYDYEVWEYYSAGVDGFGSAAIFLHWRRNGMDSCTASPLSWAGAILRILRTFPSCLPLASGTPYSNEDKPRGRNF